MADVRDHGGLSHLAILSDCQTTAAGSNTLQSTTKMQMSCTDQPAGFIIYRDMDRYRIAPARNAYQVVATLPSGSTRLLRTCRTEEEAISHLRLLRQRAELIDRQTSPFGKQDWRG